jgi:hypothetical protein
MYPPRLRVHGMPVLLGMFPVQVGTSSEFGQGLLA